MNRRFPSRLATLCATLVLAACASTGGLAPSSALRPAASVQATRSLEGVQITPAAWPTADWWKAYGDAQLDALIGEALDGSPTLAIAAARTRRALAGVDVSRAALLPRVDAAAASTRERFSERGTTPPPYAGTTQTINELQATLSWEIDFWGRNRAAYESAVGAARAAEVDAYAARLALSTGVAQAYAELERAYLELDVANANLRERQQIYNLTRDRNAAGIDSKVELKQAESALPATREEIARLDERIALARNEIAALLGQGPDRGLAIARPNAAVLAPIALPSSVPADLIGRRPDIVAQRWRVEAARHAIDSAKAEFYPNVNLLAFVGFQAIGGGSVLSAASRMAGVTPAVTLPIFDGGRLRGNLAGVDAEYDIAVERYNQALADAMRDVVDQLASWRSVEAQRAEQRSAQATAQEAYDLALLRYREGLGNYLQVLSAEGPLLAQQSLDADLRARELTLSINLARALGGGFDAPDALAATQ
jgi:NodT family efflux transporter outer membrane factor (OMF) lipoprotein